ncbi:MAG TPA: lytic murein transglycosylase B [Burkholderiaceae bacterium]
MTFFSSHNKRSTLSLIALTLAAAFPAACADAHTKAKHAAVDKQGEYVDFNSWQTVQDFTAMMVQQHGFTRTEIETIFKNTRHIDSAIQLVKPAPVGQPKNWQAYRARFVEPKRIAAGLAFWNEHADALARAEKEYGVPADIIVGILGIETLYGQNTGSFRVIDVLATLAFDYPDTPNRTARMDYFRSELENALLFARESSIDPFSLKGSYAGAIGLPQFMPASIRKFAVDYDGDGKIDLRNSPEDAIGSIANFLSQHGWHRGEPTAFPATVITPVEDGKTAWTAYIGQGLEAKFALSELEAAGVHPSVEPPPDLPYGLIDLQNGTAPTEYWLGAPNFYAITQYNRSFFYAMSVIDLGREVRTLRDAGRG